MGNGIVATIETPFAGLGFDSNRSGTGVSPNSRKNCRHCQNQTCRVLFTSCNVSNTQRPKVLQEAPIGVIARLDPRLSGTVCAYHAASPIGTEVFMVARASRRRRASRVA